MKQRIEIELNENSLIELIQEKYNIDRLSAEIAYWRIKEGKNCQVVYDETIFCKKID